MSKRDPDLLYVGALVYCGEDDAFRLIQTIRVNQRYATAVPVSWARLALRRHYGAVIYFAEPDGPVEKMGIDLELLLILTPEDDFVQKIIWEEKL